MTIPVIFGLSGLKLTEQERKFFSDVKPSGYILFARNISSREQVTELTNSLKDISGNDIDIYIDQEGGRVARLKPPLFMPCPAANTFVEIAKNKGLEEGLKAAYDNYFSITKGLLELGINVNCVPVADLHYDYADKIIGDRSFGIDPEVVTQFCLKVMQAVQDAGGKYIIKHIPGHGRALVDSHLKLPTISDGLKDLEASDFKVFKLLSEKGANIAMTAHVIYECLDKGHPVTLSKDAINYIRDEIGFKGTLISDDINMKALNGKLSHITKDALNAGCDLVLHCSGNMEEMEEVASCFV